MGIFESFLKVVGIGGATTSVPSSTTISSDANSLTKALEFLRPLGPEFAAFHAAWISHDIQGEVLAGLNISEAFLKVAAIVYPPASAVEGGLEIIEMIAPLAIQALVNFGDNLVPDGRGGFTSQSWNNNPRHQLNPDGTFKF